MFAQYKLYAQFRFLSRLLKIIKKNIPTLCACCHRQNRSHKVYYLSGSIAAPMDYDNLLSVCQNTQLSVFKFKLNEKRTYERIVHIIRIVTV